MRVAENQEVLGRPTLLFAHPWVEAGSLGSGGLDVADLRDELLLRVHNRVSASWECTAVLGSSKERADFWIARTGAIGWQGSEAPRVHLLLAKIAHFRRLVRC